MDTPENRNPYFLFPKGRLHRRKGLAFHTLEKVKTLMFCSPKGETTQTERANMIYYILYIIYCILYVICYMFIIYYTEGVLPDIRCNVLAVGRKITFCWNDIYNI